ncbi:MAG: mechanosensitive ion channel domain-containing protein [Acidobacteriota bacterium]
MQDFYRQLLAQDNLQQNATLVAVEVLALVLALVLVGRLSGRLQKALLGLPAMASYRPQIEPWRRRLRPLLIVLGLLSILALIGGNLYILFALGETDLTRYTLDALRSIPPRLWIGLGLALGKVAALVVATRLILRWLRPRLLALAAKAKAFEGLKANDESIDALFGALERVMTRCAWLGAAAWLARWLALLAELASTLLLVLRIYLIIGVALVLWRALETLLSTLIALAQKYADDKGFEAYFDRLRPLLPLFGRTVEYVLYLSAATLVLLQVEAVAPFAEWGPRLIHIIGFFFVARALIEVANLAIAELLTGSKLSASERQHRATLLPLLGSLAKYGIYLIFLVLTLEELGVDPTPILAGAGIVGLAVGLGAQNLITDLVSGFFILFEEYYLVGDYVQIAQAEGLVAAEGVVEEIDLRTTRVRDLHGRHHILRNGQIIDIANFSKGYVFAVVHLAVAIDTNLEAARAVITDIGQTLAETNGDVLEATQLKGVEKLTESEMVLLTLTRAKPGRHKQVERDLRGLIKGQPLFLRAAEA